MIGHLGPVRCLAVIRGVDSLQHRAVSHTEPVVNPFDDQSKGGFDADATGDAAADALLHRANGVGLVSGGDDGAVRLWAPGGFSGSSGSGGPFGGQLRGRTHGGAWSCVGVAHAHGAAVVIAEAGAGFARRGSRFRQSSVLTVSTDNGRGRRLRATGYIPSELWQAKRSRLRDLRQLKGGRESARRARIGWGGKLVSEKIGKRQSRRRRGRSGDGWGVRKRTERCRLGADSDAPPNDKRTPPRASGGPAGGEAGQRHAGRERVLRHAAGVGRVALLHFY